MEENGIPEEKKREEKKIKENRSEEGRRKEKEHRRSSALGLDLFQRHGFQKMQTEFFHHGHCPGFCFSFCYPLRTVGINA